MALNIATPIEKTSYSLSLTQQFKNKYNITVNEPTQSHFSVEGVQTYTAEQIKAMTQKENNPNKKPREGTYIQIQTFKVSEKIDFQGVPEAENGQMSKSMKEKEKAKLDPPQKLNEKMTKLQSKIEEIELNLSQLEQKFQKRFGEEPSQEKSKSKPKGKRQKEKSLGKEKQSNNQQKGWEFNEVENQGDQALPLTGTEQVKKVESKKMKNKQHIKTLSKNKQKSVLVKSMNSTGYNQTAKLKLKTNGLQNQIQNASQITLKMNQLQSKLEAKKEKLSNLSQKYEKKLKEETKTKKEQNNAQSINEEPPNEAQKQQQHYQEDSPQFAQAEEQGEQCLPQNLSKKNQRQIKTTQTKRTTQTKPSKHEHQSFQNQGSFEQIQLPTKSQRAKQDNRSQISQTSHRSNRYRQRLGNAVHLMFD